MPKEIKHTPLEKEMLAFIKRLVRYSEEKNGNLRLSPTAAKHYKQALKIIAKAEGK